MGLYIVERELTNYSVYQPFTYLLFVYDVMVWFHTAFAYTAAVFQH